MLHCSVRTVIVCLIAYTLVSIAWSVLGQPSVHRAARSATPAMLGPAAAVVATYAGPDREPLVRRLSFDAETVTVPGLPVTEMALRPTVVRVLHPIPRRYREKRRSVAAIDRATDELVVIDGSIPTPHRTRSPTAHSR